MAKNAVCMMVLTRLSHACLFGDIVAVDDVELEFLFNDRGLNFAWQVVPDFILSKQAVEQEDRAFFGVFQNIIALEEAELVTGHKIRLICLDEIGCTEWVLVQSAGEKWSSDLISSSHTRSSLAR